MVLVDGPVILILPKAQGGNQTGNLLLQGTDQEEPRRHTTLTQLLRGKRQRPYGKGDMLRQIHLHAYITATCSA